MQEHERWVKPWKAAPAWRAMADEFGREDRMPDEEEFFEAARSARADDPRPNILFLFTDQQTAGAMSCAGNRYVNTPAMDALAQRGVRFARTYCTGPICSPSRSSLVTGRMPHETGVVFNGQPLRPSVPTVGGVFREAGYETVWCGKWHLPDSYVDDYDGVRGFDNIPHTRNQRNLYGLGDQVDFLHAMDAVFLLRWELHKIGLPWLLGVSLHNPHDICHWTTIPPRPHPNVERYPPLPDNFGVPPDEPEFLKMQQFGPRYNGRKGTERVLQWGETQWRAYVEAYYHMTEQVDRAVGLILDALAEGGWLEDTLVIFTSDHGDGCAAHQWVGKNSFYEEQVNVPFIVSFPGRVPEGATDEEHLVSGLDVVPTMCDYAGVDPPLTRGCSVRPVIEEPEADWREHVVSEVAAPRPGDEERCGRMVRGRRYKYCVYSVGERRERLSDMTEDPGEMVNLASEPGLKNVVAEHRGILREWIDETDDPFSLG